MYVINIADELKLKHWYVSIRDIIGDKGEVLLLKDVIVQVDYKFSSFNDISFMYPTGELLKPDINYKKLDKAFRSPYTNEFKLTRTSNGKD